MPTGNSVQDATIALVSVVTTVNADEISRHLHAISNQLKPPHEHLWLCEPDQSDELKHVLQESSPSGESTVVTSLTEVTTNSNANFVWLVPTNAEPTPTAVESIIFDIHIYGPASLIFGDEYYTQARREPQPIFRPNLSPLTKTDQEPIGRSPIVKAADLPQLTLHYTQGTEATDIATKCWETELRIRQLPSLLVHYRDCAPPRNSFTPQIEPTEAAEPKQQQLVSIIIPSAGFPSKTTGQPAILELMDSLSTTVDERTEVIVVCDEGFDPNLLLAISKRLPVPVRFLQHDRQGSGFNFARMINQGALSAHGEVLIFLNDDITEISSNWIAVIRNHLEYQGTGVLGAWITEPSGHLWHFGFSTQPADGGLPIHAGVDSEPTFQPEDAREIRRVLANTAALLCISPDAFWQVGGFSCILPTDANDVDLSIKLAAQSIPSTTTAEVHATHDYGTSRGRNRNFAAEELLQSRWQTDLASDPWRNPNIAHETLKPMPDWQHWERQRPALSRESAPGLSIPSPTDDSHELQNWPPGFEKWDSIREAGLIQPRRRRHLR